MRAYKLFAAVAVTVAVMGVAQAETVVIVSAKNPATRMFSEQAAQFFLGKSTMFTPVDQADGSAIRNDFYKKVTDKDAAQVKIPSAGCWLYCKCRTWALPCSSWPRRGQNQKQ